MEGALVAGVVALERSNSFRNRVNMGSRPESAFDWRSSTLEVRHRGGAGRVLSRAPSGRTSAVDRIGLKSSSWPGMTMIFVERIRA